MKYLLDTNVLVALLIAAHEHHESAEIWVGALNGGDDVLLCPWSEIGFIRVALAAGYVPDVTIAQRALAAFRAARAKVAFAADDRRAAHLPSWAKTPGQIGDGHLASLAATCGAKLVTFDKGIPGAKVIA